MKYPVAKFVALSLFAVTVALPAPAAADPPPWAPAHGYQAKRYQYVYYPRYEVYYAPQTQLWFWQTNGHWRMGASLPTSVVIDGAPGVYVILDTERPYERHAYVVEHYGRHHGRNGQDDED